MQLLVRRPRPNSADSRSVPTHLGLGEVEWIVRGRLTRPQIRRLLLESLTALVRDVLPEVERTRPEPTP